MKLSEEDLSDIMIQSLALSILTLEKYEIMIENGLVIQKAKQTVKACIPFLNDYANKVFSNYSEDEKEHQLKGANYVSELINRIEKALTVENLLTISDRQDKLKQILNDNIINESIYNQIINSEILNY